MLSVKIKFFNWPIQFLRLQSRCFGWVLLSVNPCFELVIIHLTISVDVVLLHISWLKILFQCGHSTKRSQVEAVVEPDSLNALEKLGDWLVLYFISINLDTLTVNDVIKQVRGRP